MPGCSVLTFVLFVSYSCYLLAGNPMAADVFPDSHCEANSLSVVDT